MIAHGKDANSWYFDRIMALKATGKVKVLLGFNEPDRKPPGGDISPEAALNAWPLFEKTGLRLGSPAVAFDDVGEKWLEDFMAGVKSRHFKVDFVAVHWYGDVADPHAAKKFTDWLNSIHNKYNRPVWDYRICRTGLGLAASSDHGGGKHQVSLRPGTDSGENAVDRALLLVFIRSGSPVYR